MNLKQLGILIVAVVVIGGAALMLHNKQDSSWANGSPEAGKKLLGDNFPFNDVAHIRIEEGTNELNLVKKDDVWRVQEREDYPANFQQISEFLLKARDLKIVRSEEIGPSQLPRMGLAQGQGTNVATMVELTDAAAKPIRTLLLGKKDMRKSGGPAGPGADGGDEGVPDGRYVQVGSDSKNVDLISDPLENMEPKPDQWVNKDFFRVEKPKAIEVDFPVATNSWKLTRDSEEGDWKLADAKTGEELDSSKVSGVSSPFTSPNFNDIKPETKDNGASKPTVVRIETFDGFDYTVTAGEKMNDDYPVTLAVAAQFPKARVPGKDEKPEDKAKLDKEFADAQQKLADKLKQEKGYENWTYLVPGWVVDPVLKNRSELLAEKKEEPKTASTPEGSLTTNQVDTATSAAKN